MELLPLSFLAGILTVLAPCVLPLLPVIIGGSIAEKSIIRPVVITMSLAISIVLFTLALKASSALIVIPQAFWKYFSGGIILLFAVTLLFPIVWARMVHRIGLNRFEQQSNKRLYKYSKQSSLLGMVATGAALGPVFASCSPTYFFVLGTVLPASWWWGVFNLTAYALGLSFVMFAVSFAGQKLLSRINGLSNPHGWFKRGFGTLFLLVGLGIITGYDKKIESAILDAGYFDITKVEQKLLDGVISDEDPEESVIDPRLSLDQSPGDLFGAGEWFNSNPIDSLDQLRGKVVAVKFWTYSCINCIRTLDETQVLWEKYQDDEFVLIGVHSPEFAYEKSKQSLEQEIARYGLTFPIVQDNDFEIWKSFNNRYWPAWYLIDHNGRIRYTHLGEGKYQEKEDLVDALLQEIN